MIGKCPQCGIDLKEPPFTDRERRESLITLRYRDFIENNKSLPSIEKAGYCEVCNATLNDLKEQRKILNIARS